MIRHVGGQWYLFTKDGHHVLGVHDTFKEAHAQEVAIRISQARSAGYKTPQASKSANRKKCPS